MVSAFISRFPFVLLFLLLASPCLAFGNQVVQWSDLPPEAMAEDGLARVIAEFDVPNIDHLRAASQRAKGSAVAPSDASLIAAVTHAADQILARLDSGQRHRGIDYRLGHRYDYLPLLALSVSQETLNDLLRAPGVITIYPDRSAPLPQFNYQWTESRASRQARMGDTIDLIGVHGAWERGYTGRGWYVAVLDTGIRASHEFFEGKEILEACFSTPEYCPNGHSVMVGPGAAAHFPVPIFGVDHGTHVSGIAAGARADGSLLGVAKDAGIIAINVFHIPPAVECGPPPEPRTIMSDQLAGLMHVYSLRGERNIGAVNMSLGGGQFDFFCDEFAHPVKMGIDLLRAANIPTVIATGNDAYCNAINTPACISSAFPVMASTKRDMEAKFNNWSPALASIFAPGQTILSATGESDDSYATAQGTSMAAPHVAGAMTLMRQARPETAPEFLFERLADLGPLITAACDDGGGAPRLYIDNFGLSRREKADILFDRLEAEYPDILIPRGATQTVSGLFYRSYEPGRVYLATYQGIAYFVGQNGNVQHVGIVDELI